jgi:hypothetical protein
MDVVVIPSDGYALDLISDAVDDGEHPPHLA